jgi:acyl-CoA reductase-like NAD-dependent aldehyde dehydrogenase
VVVDPNHPGLNPIHEIIDQVEVARPDAGAQAEAGAVHLRHHRIHVVEGLGASIWSRDFNLINDFVDRVQAGMVWINNHNTLDLSLPFGGWKQSGVGHELGEEGLFSHLAVKAGVIRR